MWRHLLNTSEWSDVDVWMDGYRFTAFWACRRRLYHAWNILKFISETNGSTSFNPTHDIHTKFHGDQICRFDVMISSLLQDYWKMTYPKSISGGGRSLLLFNLPHQIWWTHRWLAINTVGLNFQVALVWACVAKRQMIGWRNVWSMKWRVSDQEVDQRGLGKFVQKDSHKHKLKMEDAMDRSR